MPSSFSGDFAFRFSVFAFDLKCFRFSTKKLFLLPTSFNSSETKNGCLGRKTTNFFFRFFQFFKYLEKNIFEYVVVEGVDVFVKGGVKEEVVEDVGRKSGLVDSFGSPVI